MDGSISSLINSKAMHVSADTCASESRLEGSFNMSTMSEVGRDIALPFFCYIFIRLFEGWAGPLKLYFQDIESEV